MFKDNVEQRLRSGRLRPEHLPGMVRCTLAHELTHVLQQQRRQRRGFGVAGV